MTPAASEVRARDHRGLSRVDPGLEPVLDAAVGWLGRAQDHSRTGDGGVARHYCLLTGWGSSYPETTGYIVPTLFDYARSRGGAAALEARGRARRMLDWLVSIQFPDGSFQGGMVDQGPVKPVTFNTGQILLGLAAGVREFGGAYHGPMIRAADWLVETQDLDGCWRRFPTPFAAPGEKCYETHVALALLEAHRVVGEGRYRRSALANIRWALGRQRPNGWIDDCDLTDPRKPLTHTLGYALRGVIEGYVASGDADLLAAARRTADGALRALRADGFLPGRVDERWNGVVPSSCLTGTAQLAVCWFLLHRETGDPRYLDAALRANRYVRRTVELDGPPETRGGVKGSYPVDGEYGTYQFLNWAAKFLIDALLMERGSS